MKLLFCMYAGIHRKQFCMALNSYKFYTTGIMTTAENCVILGYRKKISGGRELHRKEKDMTTMYRFDQLHSERKSLALLKDHEQPPAMPITYFFFFPFSHCNGTPFHSLN